MWVTRAVGDTGSVSGVPTMRERSPASRSTLRATGASPYSQAILLMSGVMLGSPTGRSPAHQRKPSLCGWKFPCSTVASGRSAIRVARQAKTPNESTTTSGLNSRITSRCSLVFARTNSSSAKSHPKNSSTSHAWLAFAKSKGGSRKRTRRHRPVSEPSFFDQAARCGRWVEHGNIVSTISENARNRHQPRRQAKVVCRQHREQESCHWSILYRGSLTRTR